MDSFNENFEVIQFLYEVNPIGFNMKFMSWIELYYPDD